MRREIIVGDIHGCYDELITLLDKVGFTSEDIIVSVGDILDRGEKSLEVFKFFKNTANSTVVLGNHERKHLNGILSYSQEIVRVQFGEEYDELITWLKKCPHYYEGTYANVVHGGFENDKPIHKQRIDVLTGASSGDRYLKSIYNCESWTKYYNNEKPIIYGHNYVGEEAKVINEKVYAIDTGACHGGFLTAVVLPEFKFHSVRSKKDYWEISKKKWQLEFLKQKDWDNLKYIEIEYILKRHLKSESEDVRNYMENKKQIFEKREKIIKIISCNIKRIVKRIEKDFGVRRFNNEASKYPFSKLLFLSKKRKLNNIKIKSMYKTPKELYELEEQLKEYKN